MRFPRNTTRRLMAVVAAASVVLGGWVEVPRLRGRAEGYRQRARWHASRERHYQQMLALEGQRRSYWSAMAREWSRRTGTSGRHSSSQGQPEGVDPWGDLARQAELLSECRRERIDRLSGNVGHYARLRQKYEEAAARPWIPVWPDPPPPE